MSLTALRKELRNFDWGNLSDIDSIGGWPGIVKIIIASILLAVCVGAGFWFDIRGLQAELTRWQDQESTLRAEFEAKAVTASNLEEYIEQTVQMEAAFSELLRQLPSQTEVPDLVDDITETGLGSSLAFSRIELDSEVAQEFYIEQPILVEVLGNYHDFGTFVSGVASLPRIVTLHDFSIVPVNNRNSLQLTITAKTYRYRTEGELDAQVPQQ